MRRSSGAEEKSVGIIGKCVEEAAGNRVCAHFRLQIRMHWNSPNNAVPHRLAALSLTHRHHQHAHRVRPHQHQHQGRLSLSARHGREGRVTSARSEAKIRHLRCRNADPWVQRIHRIKVVVIIIIITMLVVIVITGLVYQSGGWDLIQRLFGLRENAATFPTQSCDMLHSREKSLAEG